MMTTLICLAVLGIAFLCGGAYLLGNAIVAEMERTEEER